MSIIQFFRILWARGFVVLVAMLASFAGAFVVTVLAQPRYEATSRLMLDLLKPDTVTGALPINPKSAGSYIATQKEIIRDYGVTGPVVDALGWLSDPGRIRSYQSRPKTDTRDFRRWLSQRVADSTKINVAPGGIVEITFSSGNPVEAKEAAEALRTAYIDTSLRSRRENASRNAKWWSEQADAARRQAEAAEVAKATFERENGMVMQGSTDLEGERLMGLASQAAVVPFNAPVTASAAGLQLAQIDAQIAMQSETLGPSHPVMQELQSRRTTMAAVVAKEAASARAASSGTQRAAVIDQALASQKSRVIAQRDKVERLRQLEADAQLRRDQYRKTAARAADLSLEAAVADPGISTLGVVVTPSKPAFPNKRLMLGGSLALGAALGLALALLIELLNRRVRGIEDLVGSLDVPCLAVVRGQESANRGGLMGVVRGLLPRKVAAA